MYIANGYLNYSLLWYYLKYIKHRKKYNFLLFKVLQGFPSGPVDKTSLSSAGDVGSIPAHRAMIPHASRSQTTKT